MAASSLSTKPTEWYVSPMSLSHQRKKQPELVRRSLIDCAARIVAEAGVGGATIQAVADAAGVTKGGLLHHFPSKQILIEALFADLLEQLDAQLDAQLEGEIEGDARSYGRFTRASVRAMTRLSSEERRVGQECVRTCRSRWSPYH